MDVPVWTDVVARSLVCTPFVWSGLVDKPTNFSAIRTRLRKKNFPLPGLCLAGAIALEIVGSLVILLPRAFVAESVYFSVLLLMGLYTAWTAMLFHPFWKADAAQRTHERANFLKNVGLIGAFLLLIERAY